MKRLVIALMALVPLAATPAPPLKAGVYAWKGLEGATAPRRAERLVLSGETLDCESLEIRAITLSAGSAADSGTTHPDLERFLMVKEGDLRVTIGDSSKVLGAGSVAVALPGDRQRVANAGTVPVTYYQFTYRSRAPMDMERGRTAGGSFMVDWSTLEDRTTASGSRRDVFDRPTAMFRRFEAHATTVNQGLRNHATHTHRAEEFVMMMKGRVELLIGETKPTATTGDVVFLETQLPHSLVNSGTGPTQYLVMQGE